MHQVQGSGSSSPLAGQTVTVEGVLTQDSRDRDGFNGFYLQQADAETDQNPATSEALFIYTHQSTGKPGQRLRLTGTVKEFHGLTELVNVRELTVCGNAALPHPINVSIPWTQPPESLENMRVRFTDPLTVIDHYNLTEYGELTLAANDQVTPTEYLAPGSKALRQSQRNNQHRVLLDDGQSVRNPDPIPWPPDGLEHPQTLRAGDTITGIEGVLDYRFGQWRIQPDRPPRFKRLNARPEAPARPSKDSQRLMTLNLENFFNGDGKGGGFPTARGAQHPNAFRRQSQRLVAAILQSDPDILAVTEMENDGYGPDSALAELARQLGADWSFIATPGQDGRDAIRNALLYRSDRVTPIGAAMRPDTGRFSALDRPPVAQIFRFPGSVQTVRVVVPHLKSKSCRNARSVNSDQQDGQGCFNHRRVQAANAILEWLATLPQPQTLAGTLIAGDLNSYAQEDPMQIFYTDGYISLAHHFQSCDANHCDHHSYRYQGEKGSLDYILASGTLLPYVVNAQSWNINADEPRALGYGHSAGRSVTGPWRASDHNPLITDLKLPSR
ncbi:endonuclease [Marinobacter halophilus]|uniref:Endonuclease n=2 Tax=Marinobacter halophilus TaxID=1323740 RepID=A0A2T1KLC9_9GAMM|nr:ExeM/NucH family extracellular endonuclease [Marinobacter halophilus]PSF10442.1 endonuclease [Marinobacter halophilus]